MADRADPHSVLGVPRGATVDEVRRAYRRIALALHPDRNPGNPEAERLFKEASRAYEILAGAEGISSEPVRKGAKVPPVSEWTYVDLGGAVEAALRRPRSKPPAFDAETPPDAKPFRLFPEPIKKRLLEKMGGGVRGSHWKQESLPAKDAFARWFSKLDFDSAKTKAAAARIGRQDGVVFPLFVDPIGQDPPLVWGRHRAAAARDLGLTEVPVFVRVV